MILSVRTDTINCLIELNAARAKADLDPFSTEQTAGKKLPIEEQGYKDAVCSQIRKESVFILTGTPNNSTSNDADKQHNMEMVTAISAFTRDLLVGFFFSCAKYTFRAVLSVISS